MYEHCPWPERAPAEHLAHALELAAPLIAYLTTDVPEVNFDGSTGVNWQASVARAVASALFKAAQAHDGTACHYCE